MSSTQGLMRALRLKVAVHDKPEPLVSREYFSKEKVSWAEGARNATRRFGKQGGRSKIVARLCGEARRARTAEKKVNRKVAYLGY